MEFAQILFGQPLPAAFPAPGWRNQASGDWVRRSAGHVHGTHWDRQARCRLCA